MCEEAQFALDKLSQLSTETIQSMDNNIALMNNIISLHESLSRSRDNVDTVLERTTFYSEQMHLMEMRTKYFEAQLNILQAHTTFNSLVQGYEKPGANWRTTEATLENLYLEFHYHTIKFQEALKASKGSTDIDRSRRYSTPRNPGQRAEDKNSKKALSKKESRALLLKPLRTSAKRNSRMLASPMTPQSPEEFNDSSLTLNNSCEEELYKGKNLSDILESHETKMNWKQHKRSASIPVTPVSQVIDVFEDFDTVKNVRHYISYDTGLDAYKQNEFEVTFDNSSIIKESEMVGSYQSSPEGNYFSFEDMDTPRPTLKKSTSHDSIFGLVGNTSCENPSIPSSSSWMDRLNQKMAPTIGTTNVTVAKPVQERAARTPGGDSENSFFKNFNDFLAPMREPTGIPQAKTSKQLLNAVATNSYVKKLEKEGISVPAAVRANQQHEATDSHNLKTQWMSFVSKLKLPPTSVVTSEVGRPVAVPSAAKTFAPPNPGQSPLKGSYSTLTIGPNHSRIINYGDNDRVPGNVLSTRVSHAALTEALNDSAYY